jgi:hypothetical protein
MQKRISVIMPLLISSPWQEELARFTIKTMRMRTAVPFELVIVETGSNNMRAEADQYVHCPKRTNYTHDFNLGVDAATGDFLIHTGLDMIVGKEWLEALLECFDIPHTGIATLNFGEPGAHIGPVEPEETFDEAWYGPMMMFRKGWKLDPLFPAQGSDNDLIMRHYEEGFRAIRNNRVKCFHIGGVSWTTAYSRAERDRIAQQAYADFKDRYSKSPLAVFRMMVRGQNQYSKEHLS